MSALVNVSLAVKNDSKDIFQWRNDSVTRAMSHSKEAVDWNGHSKWYEASLINENRLLVLCSLRENNEKIAFVRFDIENNSAIVSINLAPQSRGKSLAKACLINSIDYMYSKNASIVIIKAEIKVINIASQKTFEGIGFMLKNEYAAVKYYELVKVDQLNY
jgi:UDP-2,4-diacetamido-2,4,6-trideoxy-beta-L-altropyranose hydrolase